MADETSPHSTLLPVDIEAEMKKSYLDYAMSVIVARAIPDVRDGLKPVQRRILVAMNDLGLASNRGYRKCAKICGDTSGNYHPHGEAVIYPTLVRLAQPFNLRYPLVDGQGNFGSVDGDPPAAMRYTEARLARISEELLADLEKETVDFVPNFDQTREEPFVLPSRVPNLLVNGASGIAVGMATNIPPHNLNEIVEGLLLLLENPETSLKELMKVIPGPDFPTAGYISGREGILAAYKTGRGSFIMRAKAAIEQAGKERENIVITEIPYQVNKARLVERIAELVQTKKIEGIADVRDESDRAMIIFEELVYQDAQKKRVTIPVERLNKAEAEFRTQFDSPAAFQQYLQAEYQGSEQALREKIRRSLLIEQLLKAEVDAKSTVSVAEVRAYYEKNSARFQYPESFLPFKPFPSCHPIKQARRNLPKLRSVPRRHTSRPRLPRLANNLACWRKNFRTMTTAS